MRKKNRWSMQKQGENARNQVGQRAGRRKGTGKRAASLAVILAALLLFGGCNAAKDNAKSEAYDAGNYMVSTTMAATAAQGGWVQETVETEWDSADGYESGSTSVTSSESITLNDSARKLIKEASLTVETMDYDTFLEQIEAEIAQLGGYIENYENNNKSYYSGRYSRYAYITARIPQQYFEAFLNTVGNLGNITNESKNATDITMSYVDTESRKKALEIEQERLLALLEKADKIEDIITLEERLSEVRYQLESYASQLRTYDNLVSYSTVSLNIQEVLEMTKEEPLTLVDRMSRGFSDTISDIVEGAKDFAVWFVTNFIYLIFWAILIIVLFLVVGRMIKKLEKNAKKQREHAAKSAGNAQAPDSCENHEQKEEQ
ncbi:MAG: DUF4349 domain-containing protein [Lachnospiraceae bacterium]|nr:DUF4349 domain-containing protein [Lachnospiraceae bacterium]